MDRIEVRQLARTELWRVGEIDRTEHIELLYEQRGTELVERPGVWDSPSWFVDRTGEHSVDEQRRALELDVDAGGVAFGAFADERLVGIAAVIPHLRPGVAQLAFLHVTQAHRASGIGRLLCAEMDEAARRAGDTAMVVSATPSANTVRFYRGRGFEPMAEPFAELFELEPEDVHMHKLL